MTLTNKRQIIFIAALLISILILTTRLFAQEPDSTGTGGPTPIPIFTSVWSMLLFLFNVALIPFLVDKLAPVTWKSGTKILVLVGLSVAASVLQLMSEGRLEFRNLAQSALSLLGTIQIYYNLFVKKFKLEGPKEQIMDQAKAQIAHQVDALSHSEAKAILDPLTPAVIQLAAEVK